MRLGLVAALVAAAAAGCGDLFHGNEAPEGYACSATGGCPPGQQCVPNEHICRTPCTQTQLGGMGMTTGNSGQCQINNPSGLGGGWSCDYDHFCRPRCFGGNGGSDSCPTSSCTGTDICDTTLGICRPSCSSGCPSSWGCIDLSLNTGGGGTGTPMVCLGCRPLATGGFTPPTFAPLAFADSGVSGQHTSGVMIGDLGTGHPSAIALDTTASKLYVYGNSGDGVLTAPTAYTLGNQPIHAAIVDITRDGKPDLVVASVPRLVVLPGNGDGTLGALVIGPTFPSTNLATGDFNNDGKPDVAFCGSGTNQLHIITSDGAGGFTTIATFSSPNNTASFVRIGAADFNNDKKMDLWVDDERGGLTTFLNPGGSTFTFNGGPQLMSTTRLDDVAFDADGDNLPDVVVLQKASMTGPGSPYSIMIAHNSGSGGLTMTPQLTLPGGTAIAAGDFDGDGHIDAAIADQETTGANGVHIFSGTGKTLVYTGMLKVPSGGPSSIAVGDLNGDGKPDIVVGLGGGGVGVFLNQTIR